MVHHLIVHNKHLRVSEFVEPENWPLNILYLNSVDYLISEALEQPVYCRHRIRDVEYLKEVPQTCWEQTGQDVMDRTTEQFLKQL